MKNSSKEAMFLNLGKNSHNQAQITEKAEKPVDMATGLYGYDSPSAKMAVDSYAWKPCPYLFRCIPMGIQNLEIAKF
jgi:hypothetical protein